MPWDESLHPRGATANRGQFTEKQKKFGFVQTPIDNRSLAYRLWAYNRGIERQLTLPTMERDQKKGFRNWASRMTNEELAREVHGRDDATNPYDIRPARLSEIKRLGSNPSPIPGMRVTGIEEMRTARNQNNDTSSHPAVQWSRAREEFNRVEDRVSQTTSPSRADVEGWKLALNAYVGTHPRMWVGPDFEGEAWESQMRDLYDKHHQMTHEDLYGRFADNPISLMKEVRSNTRDYQRVLEMRRNIAQAEASLAKDENDKKMWTARANEHAAQVNEVDDKMGAILDHFEGKRDRKIEEKEERKREAEEEREREEKEEREREESYRNEDTEYAQEVIEKACTIEGVRPTNSASEMSADGHPNVQFGLIANKDFVRADGTVAIHEGEEITAMPIERELRDDGKSVYNAFFVLKKEAQGFGLATEIQAHAMSVYRSAGVEHMDVHAYSDSEKERVLKSFQKWLVGQGVVETAWQAEAVVRSIGAAKTIETFTHNGRRVGEEFLASLGHTGETTYASLHGKLQSSDKTNRMNGGLTWAKLGFDWDRNNYDAEKSRVLGRFQKWLSDSGSCSREDAAKVVSMVNHPWEVANVKVNGRRCGEEFLKGIDWHGSFDLDKKSESSMYFEQYLAASRAKKTTKKTDAA